MCMRDFRSFFAPSPAPGVDAAATAYAMVRHFDQFIRAAADGMDEVAMRQRAILAWEHHPEVTATNTDTRSYRERYEDTSMMGNRGRAKILNLAMEENEDIRLNWVHRDVWARAYQACSAASALVMQMIEQLEFRVNVRFAPTPQLAALDPEAASFMQLLFDCPVRREVRYSRRWTRVRRRPSLCGRQSAPGSPDIFGEHDWRHCRRANGRPSRAMEGRLELGQQKRTPRHMARFSGKAGPMPLSPGSTRPWTWPLVSPRNKTTTCIIGKGARRVARTPSSCPLLTADRSFNVV